MEFICNAGHERHALRKRAGFTPEEVTEFTETFDHYDKDKSGALSKQDCWNKTEHGMQLIVC